MGAKPKRPWSHVQRLLIERPDRLAGGTAAIEPLELLAVEHERVALKSCPADDGGSNAMHDSGDDAA